MFGSVKDVQWQRQCSVIFKNYPDGIFTTINDYTQKDADGSETNKFRVEFDYLKSIDETSNDSNGTIKIYGLTLERFQVLGNPNETEVELHAGYKYSETNGLRLLFKAIVVDKSYEHQNGNSVSTFKVLGDFIGKNVKQEGSTSQSSNLVPVCTPKNKGSKVSASFSEGALVSTVIFALAEAAGFSLAGIRETWLKMVVNDTQTGRAFSEDQRKARLDEFGKYLMGLNYPYGVTFYGTPKQALQSLCDDIGMGYSVSDKGKTIIFEFTRAALVKYADRFESTRNPLASVVKAAENKTATPDPVEPALTPVENLVLKDSPSILLNKDTGLLGTPSIKTKTITRAYPQVLQANERLVEQQAPRIKKNSKGEPVVDKETGKVKFVTPKTKKVSRRQVLAECLINASIEPQSYVTIDTEMDNFDIDGDYRVRNVRINGDLEGSAWNMSLELEGEF